MKSNEEIITHLKLKEAKYWNELSEMVNIEFETRIENETAIDFKRAQWNTVYTILRELNVEPFTTVERRELFI
jgi:hypothetical protein